MRADFLKLAVPGVQQLAPYVPGKPISELERELGIREAIKLASNENPLGPSEQVLAAVQAALPELTRYPDGNGFSLKRALATRHQVEPNQITLGNGSNDVLEMIARAYLQPGTSAVFSQYAFAVYPLATQAAGADAVVVPACEWGHDLAAMLAAIREDTRVVFIANPNNPTGTSFGKAEWETFIAGVPAEVIVVLDEAYIEYNDQAQALDGTAYLSRYPNLVLTRTFSKAYGLAALRVGYSLSQPAIADVLNRVRQPFNVNSLALVAAEAALADEAYLERSRALNAEGMQQLQQGCQTLGVDWIPSAGNFLTLVFDPDVHPDAAAINAALLQQGVIVRPLAGYGMAQALRVSIGLPTENARFLEALAEVLA